MRIGPENALVLNNLASLFASCPKDDLRDGQRSLELATKACTLSKWQEPSHVDTLAAAYAEVGDFTTAIKWQKKVIDLWKDDKVQIETAQERLKSYEERKPVRE